MKKILILMSSIWVMLIAASFFGNYTQLIKEQEKVALETGRSFFELMVITRSWNARHGGVYVPVTKETLPNPYLEVPMRDIDVAEDLKLTKINPAFMTRQISNLAVEQNDVQFHITSLNPIRPQNGPTSREKQYLKAFERGVKEIGRFVKEGSNTSFFYMAPLKTKKSCLKCHAKQGYREGDVRGGISIRIPFIMEMPLFSLGLGHILIAASGLCGIIVFGARLGRAYATIERQAEMDALTGIPNRRSFDEKIVEEYNRTWRAEEELSLIMCDIDNFKLYNDIYGHGSGDECLKEVAQGINRALMRPGDYCARYGGEEFAVILPNTNMAGAMIVAERIRVNIQALKMRHEKSFPLGVVTLSFGVATLQGDSSASCDELIKHADIALYKAKENGRNRVEAYGNHFKPED